MAQASRVQPTTLSKPSRETESPLFTPLGYSWHAGERWLHLQVMGEHRHYRPCQALGLGFLLSIYPDHDHWQQVYPSWFWHGQKIDWRRACAHIMRLCIAAGEYRPDNGAVAELVGGIVDTRVAGA